MKRRSALAGTLAACLATTRAAADGNALPAIAPRPQPGPPGAMPTAGHAVPPGLFGLHLHRLALNAGESGPPTPWPAVPVASLRLWDSGTLWSEIAPQRGQWSFARMDAYVNAAQLRQCSLLYTLGGTPAWASARPAESGPYGPGSSAEPAQLADWETYLRTVVSRYRGRIGAYELWNEPNFSDVPRDRGAPGFYTGSVGRLVEMGRIARAVIREIDPAALLCGPGFVNGPDRLDLFLASGGAALIDVVGYHFYTDGTPQLLAQIAQVREVMRRHGLDRLPLWNTEFGVETWRRTETAPPGMPPRDDDESAALMAQCLVVNAASDMARCYYYAWDNTRSGMWRAPGVANARLQAFESMQRWLTGARMVALRRSGSALLCEQVGERGDRQLIGWSMQGHRSWRLPTSGQAAVVEQLNGASAVVADGAVVLTPMPVRITLTAAGGRS